MKGIIGVIKQVYAIATVTFQELLREKVLWSAFVFAVLCVALSYAVSQLSFVDNGRIALDFGLTAISVVGGLISVIMGANLIAKEVQNRTLYLVLAKSIWRWQFVIGRFAGLLGVLLVNASIMTLIALGAVKAAQGQIESAVLKSLILQVVEFGVLASTACVFSAFSTATLAGIFASGVWVIGHAMSDLRIMTQRIEPVALRPLLEVVTRILPDLTRFDVKAEVAHGLPILWSYTGMSVAYGAAYIVFALSAACLIFIRRDL